MEHLNEISHFCYSYNPLIFWVLFVCDKVIFLAYMLIPYDLYKVLKRLPKNLAIELVIFIRLLSAFIISCGLTHFFISYMVFGGWWYWLWTAFIYTTCASISVIAWVYLRHKALNLLLLLASNIKIIVNAKDLSKDIKEIEKILHEHGREDLIRKTERLKILLEVRNDFVGQMKGLSNTKV